SHKTERRCLIAGDVPIFARCDCSAADTIMCSEYLSRIRVSKSRFQRREVCGLHLGLLELYLYPLLGRLQRTIIKPVHQSEGPEVLAAIDLFWRKLHRVPKRSAVERRDRQLEQAISAQGPVFERVRLIARLLQIVLVEGVRIDD